MALSRLQTGVIVGAIVTVFVAAGFARELYSNYQVDREIARLQARTKELEAERISIVELKDRLASQDFLEGEARLKLGLKKPGETAIIIPETVAGGAPVDKHSSAYDNAGKDESNLRLWFKHFFD